MARQADILIALSLQRLPRASARVPDPCGLVVNLVPRMGMSELRQDHRKENRAGYQRPRGPATVCAQRVAALRAPAPLGRWLPPRPRPLRPLIPPVFLWPRPGPRDPVWRAPAAAAWAAACSRLASRPTGRLRRLLKKHLGVKWALGFSSQPLAMGQAGMPAPRLQRDFQQPPRQTDARAAQALLARRRGVGIMV